MASKASWPVRCSTRSAAAAYSASNDACVPAPPRTPKRFTSVIASAGAVPCSVRGSCGPSATARKAATAMRRARRSALQHAIQPAVGRALHARRAALHVVLRVEVRARRIVRSAGVDDGQRALLPQRQERRQARVQAEEAVEIERRAIASAARLGDRDRRPRRVVVALAERDDDVEAVGGAALEDRDQHLAPAGARGRGPRHERRARSPG